MALAAITAAAHGGFVALGFAAALAVFATAVFLAVLHRGLHVFAFAAGLAIFHFTLVLAATSRGILGIGGSVMAATFAVLHIGHVVMTAPLGLRGRSRVRRRRRILRPANHRQGQGQNQSKQSEFHKSSFIKVMRTVEMSGQPDRRMKRLKKN